MDKSLLLAALLVLCSFILASCEPVQVEDCGSVGSKVEEVDVTPCPKEPCELKKGTEPTVEVRFVPKGNVTKATTVIYGIIEGVKIPFPPPQSNACKDQGIVCPMMAGKEYKFKSQLPVKESYPNLKLDVIWEMVDQSSKMVYCWELAVQIVDGDTS